MAGFINIPDILANDWNLCPLPRTWYEKEVDTDETQTIRFARRRDHTGVLIRIDKAEFFEANP